MSNTLPPRERILHAVADLLETQGYHATGLNEIVSASQAPRGSLYHYFPGGKEEIAAEALQRTGQSIADDIRQQLAEHDDAIEAIVQFFIHAGSQVLSECGRSRGSAMAVVALETAGQSERLSSVCAQSYASWQQLFIEKLEQDGFGSGCAHSLATVLTAALEGGIVLCRVHRSAEPLEQVAFHMRQMLERARPPRTNS